MKMFTSEQTEEQLGWAIIHTGCDILDDTELKTVTFVLYTNGAANAFYNGDEVTVPDGEVWSGVSVKSVYKMDIETFKKMENNVVSLRKHIQKSWKTKKA